LGRLAKIERCKINNIRCIVSGVAKKNEIVSFVTMFDAVYNPLETHQIVF